MWTLSQARTSCPEMQALRSDSGAWRRMRSWKISWKCGRIHFVSPDPEYSAKLAAIAAVRQAAAASPTQVRVFYSDEASYYRTPHPGRTWATAEGGGAEQPTAGHTAGANTKRRMIAALDACTAEVISHSESRVGVKAISTFLRKLRKRVGKDARLVVIWDNWPVHRHEELARVAVQQRIEFLYVPTYAPWTNPIEKLWKKLRHDVLHLHQKSGTWTKLRAQVEEFLRKLEQPNPDLLRYVGLDGTPA